MAQLDRATKGQRERDSFAAFRKLMYPDYVDGAHLRIMADAFERVANGKLKRLIVTLPPRHMKSVQCSILFPAWFIGKFPKKKIMQVSNTAELAQGFGRSVKNLIQSAEYKAVFKDVKLAADSTAAGRWNTNQGGDYYAVGMGGAIAGRGADVLVIDDPHSEGEALAAEHGDQSIYDRAFSWYGLARQRLQPGGAIIICVTRWSQRDLVGQVLKAAKERGDEGEWEVIDFPAILPSGKAMWPQFWSIKELEKIRNELPIQRWSAQYQQSPISVAAALIKATWWREWDIEKKGKVPEFEYIIQSWDTATTANTRSNFSACTTWGMFYAPGPGGKMYPQFMLIDAFRDRLEFPDLKEKAKTLFDKYKPDCLLIENTAQGTSLIPELRMKGLPVTPFQPGRAKNDKILRVNAISDIFKSGQVWYISNDETKKVIEQFEAFPNAADGDDYVDSGTQAIQTARQGGVIRLERDEDWADDGKKKKSNSYYSVF
jgi:predicted phage terminase large subunit-like protein